MKRASTVMIVLAVVMLGQPVGGAEEQQGGPGAGVDLPIDLAIELPDRTTRPGVALGGGDPDLEIMAVLRGESLPSNAVLASRGLTVASRRSSGVELSGTRADLARLVADGLGSDIVRAYEPDPAVTSEGVPVVGADAWQDIGFDGTGVKVAIIDTGFTGYAALLGSELPASVTTASYHAGGISGSGSHGTGVAEIVHDVAPGAELYLIAIDSEFDLNPVVTYLIGEGVDVVNMSLGWPIGPFDGSAPVAVEAQRAADAGIVWANSAGNSAEKHWGGAFVDTDVDPWAEFDEAGNELMPFFTTDGFPEGVYLSWNDLSTDYDLCVFYLEVTPYTYECSTDIQGSGQRPVEAVEFVPLGGWYAFAVYHFAGPTGRFDAFTSAPIVDPVAATSLVSPAEVEDILSVGAVEWSDTGTVETFSGRGPTIDGRLKPDVVAPDGVSTDTYGVNSFSGTSASSPHVAGMSALLLQLDPAMSASAVRAELQDEALPLTGSGTSYAWGHGLAQLETLLPVDCSTHDLAAFIEVASDSDIIEFTGTCQLDGIGIDVDVTLMGDGPSTSILTTSGSTRVFSVAADTTVTVDGATVTGGDSDHGAGIKVDPGGTLHLVEVEVSGNSAGFDGGGLWVENGTATITRSLVTGNTAGFAGGGILNDDSDVTITNSTVSGNTANGVGSGNAGGGGIYNVNSATLLLESSAVVANHANNTDLTDTMQGGGLFASSLVTITARNSVIADNTAATGGADCFTDGGSLSSAGYNLIEDAAGCSISGDTTGNVTAVDPALGPLTDNGGPTSTHSFSNTSPLFNAGNPATVGSGGDACPSTDQRNSTRGFDQCDIGPFELDTDPPVLSGVPTEVTEEATSPNGAVVTWPAPTANDATDGVLPVTCVPMSGSTFPIGTTPVECSAEDTDGNEASDGFDVVVEDPAGVFRYAGTDRYSTAAAISSSDFPVPDLVDTAFVAFGGNFPDALAGAAVAGREGAPLLLVGNDFIPPATATELVRLDLDRIVVLGGEAVVSPAVESSLGAYASTVSRLAGSNRYSTAVEISEYGFPSPSQVDTVIVATGLGFADALAGGPAAVQLGAPVLLTAPDSLPDVVADEINRLNPSRVIVVGGPAVVTGSVITALEALVPDVDRIAGSNRYSTAAAISAEVFDGGSSRVYLATGLNFPDALSGAAAAGWWSGPILLVPGDSIPSVAESEIARLAATRGVILGGTAVVTPAVESALGPML